MKYNIKKTIAFAFVLLSLLVTAASLKRLPWLVKIIREDILPELDAFEAY